MGGKGDIGGDPAAGASGKATERTLCIKLIEGTDGVVEVQSVYYQETGEELTQPEDCVVKVQNHEDPRVYEPQMMLMARVGAGVRKQVEQRRIAIREVNRRPEISPSMGQEYLQGMA